MKHYTFIIIIFFSLVSLHSKSNPANEANKYLFKRSNDKNTENANTIFGDNHGKYKYFISFLSNVSSKDALYDMVDSKITFNDSYYDTSFLQKLKKSSKDEHSTRNHRPSDEIDKFLTKDFRSQTLDSKYYNSNDIPKPLYISQLKKIAFDSVVKNDIKTLRAILDNFNMIHIKDEEGFNLLLYAVLHRKYEIVEYLIQKGVSINQVNKYGASALIIAARNDDMDMVKLLARFKPRAALKDRFNNKAIDYAIMNHNQSMQEYFTSLSKR